MGLSNTAAEKGWAENPTAGEREAGKKGGRRGVFQAISCNGKNFLPNDDDDDDDYIERHLAIAKSRFYASNMYLIFSFFSQSLLPR